MALNPKLAVASRNTALNSVLVNANSGKLRIYDGTQPTDADTAITSQVLLAELTLNATAFAGASGGSASANAITPESNAPATGVAAWFRLFESDGTTVIMDGSVGTATANLVLNSVSIQQHAQVSASSFVVSMGP